MTERHYQLLTGQFAPSIGNADSSAARGRTAKLTPSGCDVEPCGTGHRPKRMACGMQDDGLHVACR